MTIVGVVGEVRRNGKSADLTPQVDLSAAQIDPDRVRLGSVAVRADGEPYALVTGNRRAVRGIDGDQPISGVMTLDEVASASMAQLRFYITLLSLFAALALGLAWSASTAWLLTAPRSERARSRSVRSEPLAAMSLRWSSEGGSPGLSAASLWDCSAPTPPCDS